MKKFLPALCLSFLLSVFAIQVRVADAAPRGKLSGMHGDKTLLPKSCRACHRGMNMSISGEEAVCLNCHSNRSARQQMIAQGYVSASARSNFPDIEAELRKPYSHPVLAISGVHQQREALPEEMVNARRHAECIDCHEPHELQDTAPFRGIRRQGIGNFSAEVSTEAELCYKCHGASANLPVTSSDKRAEFRSSNPSFHPVGAEGANAYVISLKPPYAARQDQPGKISTISCRDCHGSDDANGPQGPHGSMYPGLLVDNYQMESGRGESQLAYALCYRCHARNSILSDESFPYHSLHIQGTSGGSYTGTSCFTCHDAHGSQSNQYLIRFNADVVRPNIAGDLRYESFGVASRQGSCALSCHDVEHEPKVYPYVPPAIDPLVTPPAVDPLAILPLN
ncbi:MAG: cytochrome C [Deltaproteobacteria bacterium]|nr:cytochrome C [Deltaproteobacteria bacterium]NCP03104.1 cytochrome C [Deltaproteobacteria bacterium]